MDFLKRVTPKNVDEFAGKLAKFKVSRALDADCPVVDGLFDLVQVAAGGSIDGARRLMSGEADVAVNWAGGLHHAKKGEASGFCFVNDIVLAILTLLQTFERVLYIDIDVHHGDGVEEAFYSSNRVLTLSFHKYGDGFFPGSGHIRHRGHGRGVGYSMNFPLRNGIDDDAYTELAFRPVVRRVFDTFRPSAVVLQCGADSLALDKIGPFNLTIRGHGDCVRFVRSLGVPTLVLGGGGYNIPSVARCWSYETGVLLGEDLDNTIPFNDYWAYFAPSYKLHFEKSVGVQNDNDVAFLDKAKEILFENLRSLEHAPSVQMQDVPSGSELPISDHERLDPDLREVSERRQASGEFFDNDGDHGMPTAN